MLPQLARPAVEDVAGGRVAHPLTGLPIIYGRDGRRTPIFVFVYDTAGGPAAIAEGIGDKGHGDASEPKAAVAAAREPR